MNFGVHTQKGHNITANIQKLHLIQLNYQFFYKIALSPNIIIMLKFNFCFLIHFKFTKWRS